MLSRYKIYLFQITALLLIGYGSVSRAATFIVNSAVDLPGAPGPNTQTLRWAITQANAAPGADVIQFGITTSPDDIIALMDTLPTITGTVVIDATTQFAQTDVCKRVLLDGTDMATDGYGFRVRAVNCEFYGFRFEHFKLGGILIENGSERYKIGGPNLKGNVFANNQGNHISISDSPHGFILGNRIGVSCSLTVSQTCPGGKNGIYVKNSANTQIGGWASSDSVNFIGAACENGILIENSHYATIRGNLIGITPDNQNIQNQGAGIRLRGDCNNAFIGGDDPANANTLGFNGAGGVDIADNGVDFAYVVHNKFNCNEGGGIVINGPDGIGNDNAKKPVIDRVYTCNGSGVAEGKVEGAGTVRIDLFESAQGCVACQGLRYIGSTNAQNGTWMLTFDPQFSTSVTAMAILPNKNVSAFADCKSVTVIDPGPKASIKVVGPNGNELYNRQELVFTNESTPNGTCQWIIYGPDGSTTPFDTLVVDDNCGSKYTFDKPGLYSVELTVTHPQGCIDRQTKMLNILMSDLQVLNNVITKNEDGINEVLKVTGLFKTYKLLVYDRSGAEVFASDAVTNYWNGTCGGSTVCPSGTYFYIIDVVNLEGIRFRKAGQVTVIKDSN